MNETDSNGTLENSIKSFIYLDTNKMYSISSQLFSGLTEYILASNGASMSSSDEKAGGFFEGKLISKIIEQTTENSEKRFLHDYAYTLFEDKLIHSGKVLAIDSDSDMLGEDDLGLARFVKIKGRLSFHDAKMVDNILSNFNEIGYAIKYVTMDQELRDKLSGFKANVAKIKDKNAKERAKVALSKLPSIEKDALEQGLMMNSDYLENLTWILNFGYGDSFEVRIPIEFQEGLKFFSGALNRDMLRESPKAIMHKFSRETEREFTLFGILTQHKASSPPVNIFPIDDESYSDLPQEAIKRALNQLLVALSNVHGSFIGKLENEYVVDPIAVYLDL
jgi:hypothetical protein